MPDLQDCRSQDLLKYDKMTSQQLQAFLREDASKPEGEGSDPAEVLYALEMLADHARKQGEGKNPQEAFAAFKEHYDTENFFPSQPSKPQKAIRKQPWKRCVAAVLAAAVLFFVGAVTAKAFGINLRKTVAKWTAGTFSFAYADPDNAQTQNGANSRLFADSYATLNQFSLDQVKLPTRLPAGFRKTEETVHTDAKRRIICSAYTCGSREIQILVANFVATDPLIIEQGGGLIECYTVNGVDYHLFQNGESVIAAWLLDGYEYSIAGDISVDQMKEMIHSIP